MATLTVANAVGYVRMSSDKQDKSPDQQREQILALAKKLRCHVIRWYEDLGISGDNIRRRVAFRRMVADATDRHDFDLILCWSQDRFGRFDSIEAGEWVSPLRRAGVRLATVAEGEISWTDGAGRLVYTIQQEGKHTYLLDMARTSARGRVQAANRTGFVGGRVPYGYEREIYDESGRLQRRLKRTEKFRRPKGWRTDLVKSEVTEEIKAIQWMFRAYCRGMSLDAISNRLNSDRVASARGGYWCSRTVRNILENLVYVGDQVWNRRHVGKYFAIMSGEVSPESNWRIQRGEREKLWNQNPKSEWIVIPDAHPALISRTVFDRAQSRLQTRLGRAYQRPGLPLTGLVKCGHCGMHMFYHPYKAAYGGKPSVYYTITCNSRNKYGPSVCSARTIKEPWLLGMVVQILQDKVLDATIEGRLREKLAEDLSNQRKGPAELKRLRCELKKLDQQIARGLDNFLKAPTRLRAAATERLALWQDSRDQVQRELEGHDRSEQHAISSVVANLMSEVRVLRAGLVSEERQLLHHTLQRLIECITLWFEPKAKHPHQSHFSRGLMITRCPFANGQFIRQQFDFSAKDIDCAAPRWHPSRRRAQLSDGQFMPAGNSHTVMAPERLPMSEARF